MNEGSWEVPDWGFCSLPSNFGLHETTLSRTGRTPRIVLRNYDFYRGHLSETTEGCRSYTRPTPKPREKGLVASKGSPSWRVHPTLKDPSSPTRNPLSSVSPSRLRGLTRVSGPTGCHDDQSYDRRENKVVPAKRRTKDEALQGPDETDKNFGKTTPEGPSLHEPSMVKHWWCPRKEDSETDLTKEGRWTGCRTGEFGAGGPTRLTFSSRSVRCPFSETLANDLGIGMEIYGGNRPDPRRLRKLSSVTQEGLEGPEGLSGLSGDPL